MWSHKAKCFVMVQFAMDKGSTFSSRKLPLDYCKGACYEVTEEFLYEFENMKNKKERLALVQKHKIQENGKVLFKVEGVWTVKVKVNGKTAYKYSKLKKYKCER